MASGWLFDRWEQLSARDYPRRNEHGKPTYGCRWCGKQREYDPDYWIIGSFCSFSCQAAHGYYMFVCFSVMFGGFTVVLLNAFVIYGDILHSAYIIMPIIFSLLTLWSIFGVFYGRRMRRVSLRQSQVKQRYNPRIRA